MKSIAGFLGAGFLALGMATASAQNTIAVDDGQGAPRYTETGSWSTTSNTGAGYNATLYRFTRSTSPPSTATWRPDFPASGPYEVFAVFRRGADRTARAPYAVAHAGGTTTVELDQTGVFAGDLAVESLGVYLFNSGTAGSVTLSNNGGAGVYIADAILFVPDVPPSVENVRWSPLYPKASDTVTVSALIADNGLVGNVRVVWSSTSPVGSGEAAATAGAAGVYTATLPQRPDGATVTFRVEATDSLGSVYTSEEFDYVVGRQGDFRVVINEVMASNTATVFDPDFGRAADWVELYNFGPDIADLSGLAFSDRANNPTKWFFPSGVTIPPNEYLLVWCDNEDVFLNGVHTSFALSASGEDAVLYDPATETVLDSVTFGSMATDESFARIPNLTGDFRNTILPTPGAANTFEQRGPAPLFSHESGLYSSAFNVTITAPGSQSIRYTLNGAHPTATSTLYTGPVAINGTTGLRARAFYTDMEASRVTSASYFFNDAADRTIPIMNIVADPNDLFHPQTGLYTNPDSRGREWEREVHVSIISPDGSVSERIDAGIRMHGGFSRTAAKKSFRLYFRNDYGRPEWSLPWMERTPVGAIDQLVLRAGGNDGFLVTVQTQLREVTYVRDQLLRDWFHDQGHYAADGFFVALYLNGQYWGLYNATERITADQIARVFPGNSDIDVVKGTWTFATKFYTEANDGDLIAWDEFLQWHENSNLATEADFAELHERIDYTNFMEWMALNIYAQNEDWPHNNWIATRHRTRDDARWVFHEWDAEWGLGLRPNGWSSNTIRWARGDNFHLSPSHNGRIAPLSNLFSGNRLQTNRTRDINGVLDHPQGRRDFLAALEDVMNFEAQTDKAIADFNRLIDMVRTEIPRESARWASSTSVSAATLNGYWNTAVENMRNFFRNRPAALRNHAHSEFSLPGSRRITFLAEGEGSGHLNIRGRVVELPWSGWFFHGSDIELSPAPAPGSAFSEWRGLVNSADPDIVYTTTSGSDASITLVFETRSSGTNLWMFE